MHRVRFIDTRHNNELTLFARESAIENVLVAPMALGTTLILGLRIQAIRTADIMVLLFLFYLVVCSVVMSLMRFDF